MAGHDVSLGAPQRPWQEVTCQYIVSYETNAITFERSDLLTKPEPTDDQTFDLRRFLPYQLNQVAEMISKAFQECYQQDFGLTRTQWRILAHLAAFDGLTAKDIVALVHEDKVSISRGVVGLEAKGLLHRALDTRDRRAERLHLTEPGRHVFAAIAERARHFETALSAQLGREAMATLQSSLAKVQSQWPEIADRIRIAD